MFQILRMVKQPEIFLKMSTPIHITANYDAVLKKIESSNVDEAQKMFYRAFLDQTKESTNGRTEKEKIQDLTEAVAGLAQISIMRQLDNISVDDDIAQLKTNVVSIKSDFEILADTVKNLKLSYDNAEPPAPKKLIDKILDLLKQLPWSATVLGLGICGLLAYKPQFIEFVKMVFIK